MSTLFDLLLIRSGAYLLIRPSGDRLAIRPIVISPERRLTVTLPLTITRQVDATTSLALQTKTLTTEAIEVEA